MFRRNGPVDMKANPPSNSNDDEAVVSGARRNRKGSRLLGGAVICALIGIVLLWYKLVIPHPMHTSVRALTGGVPVFAWSFPSDGRSWTSSR